MPLEEKFDGFIRQYELDRIEDERRAKNQKHLEYAYIAWGLTLVMLGLAMPDSVSGNIGWGKIAVIAIIFITGWINYFKSLRWRW